MLIRTSRAAERDEIHGLHRAAFGPGEGPAVADLVLALLDDPSAQPVLSLVAEQGGRLVGSVLFTRVRIDGAGPQPEAAILCPLGVLPDVQQGGVGAALVASGCARLAAAGTALVFVLGDPRYYGRHGFVPAVPRGLPPEHVIAMPAAWQVRALDAAALDAAAGTVRCAEALADPAHW